MHKKKVERHVFNTTAVVALYLGKDLYVGQQDEIQKIVEFITGDTTKFTFEDKARHNKIQQWLLKQFEWLGHLHPKYSEVEKWMANIIGNHGVSMKLRKLVFE